MKKDIFDYEQFSINFIERIYLVIFFFNVTSTEAFLFEN